MLGPRPGDLGWQPTLTGSRVLTGLRVPVVFKMLACVVCWLTSLAHSCCRPCLHWASGFSACGRPGRPRCRNPQGMGPSLLWGHLHIPPAASRLRADDSNDMWEDPEDDEEEEEDGLAGQLLSDILATSKYGELLGGPPWPLHPGAGSGHRGGAQVASL